MPAEQSGSVRENYMWKVLLRRGEGKDGEFTHVLDPIYDKQLFQLTWGSTVSLINNIFLFLALNKEIFILVGSSWFSLR